MKHFIYLLMGLILLSLICEIQNIDDDNLYTIHTSDGDIQCNYHNSRDLNNGWMLYYDNVTKQKEYIEYWKVDSITIHRENWLTCGAKNHKMKYVTPQG